MEDFDSGQKYEMREEEKIKFCSSVRRKGKGLGQRDEKYFNLNNLIAELRTLRRKLS